MKGVRSGVESRRGVSGLKPAGDLGRRDAPEDKVLKDRRSPRERGRMGTSVNMNAPESSSPHAEHDSSSAGTKRLVPSRGASGLGGRAVRLLPIRPRSRGERRSLRTFGRTSGSISNSASTAASIPDHGEQTAARVFGVGVMSSRRNAWTSFVIDDASTSRALRTYLASGSGPRRSTG